jgi:hypothetical protein
MFDSPLLPAGSFKVSYVELPPTRQNPPPVIDISRSFASPDSEEAHHSRMDGMKAAARQAAEAEAGQSAAGHSRMSATDRAAANEAVDRLAGVKLAAALHRQAEKAAARGQTTGALMNMRI